MKEPFIQQLTLLAAADPRVFLITGDLGFGVLEDFARRFPRQFLNVGVAEQNMTGVATGLALEGRVVFTYSIGNFPTLRCLEQIRNDACYHGANVNIVSIGGGFSYGALGFSHHAVEDLAILRSLPDIAVVAPCDDWEAMEATAALAKSPGVGYLRLDKSSAGNTQRRGEIFTVGRARLLREGADMTLIACGGIMTEVLQAAETLARSGTQCRVLSMHTLKPIDRESILRAAQDTGGIVTVEEHTVEGGLGGAVAEVCLEAGIPPAVFYRIGIRAGYSAVVGSQSYLRALYCLDAQSIGERVEVVLGRQPVVAVRTASKGA